MNVGRICHRDPVTVAPDCDLGEAARLMRERHVGYLVVTDSLKGSAGHPVGVLTDRDIVVSVIARDADPRGLTVGDIMTREPRVARESESTEAALRHMREVGARRMPVVNAAGEIAGVLSMDDALDDVAEQLDSIAGLIRSAQRVERLVRP